MRLHKCEWPLAAQTNEMWMDYVPNYIILKMLAMCPHYAGAPTFSLTYPDQSYFKPQKNLKPHLCLYTTSPLISLNPFIHSSSLSVHSRTLLISLLESGPNPNYTWLRVEEIEQIIQICSSHTTVFILRRQMQKLGRVEESPSTS